MTKFLYICIILILIRIFSLASVNGEKFVVEDKQGRIELLENYFQPTEKQIKDLDYIVDTWCKHNNSSTQRFMYYRIRAFICRWTTYEYEYKNKAYAPYSAYGLLLNDKKLVCFGYATLAQKFFDKKGIENRLIWDKKNNHLYNKVKLDGVWEKADITWFDVMMEGRAMEEKLRIQIEKILRGEWD